VLTDRAGVLHGELDIHTTWADGQAVVAVQPSGAAEWFAVPESPVYCGTEQASRELHQEVVRAVRDGDVSVTLRDYAAHEQMGHAGL
jgi:hypothetical protein